MVSEAFHCCFVGSFFCLIWVLGGGRAWGGFLEGEEGGVQRVSFSVMKAEVGSRITAYD